MKWQQRWCRNAISIRSMTLPFPTTTVTCLPLHPQMTSGSGISRKWKSCSAYRWLSIYLSIYLSSFLLSKWQQVQHMIFMYLSLSSFLLIRRMLGIICSWRIDSKPAMWGKGLNQSGMFLHTLHAWWEVADQWMEWRAHPCIWTSDRETRVHYYQCSLLCRCSQRRSRYSQSLSLSLFSPSL